MRGRRSRSQMDSGVLFGKQQEGGVGDYKAVSQKVVEVSRQWSKECGRWAAESVVGR